jgi:uncharacterized membrane protein
VKKHIESELMPDNHRVENFSDAVFAIVVTIMVLEIRIPDSFAFSNDPVALKHFGTYLGTYALSFLVIANLWTSHHYLLFTVGNPARSTLWYNSLLLFSVTLVPLATRFLGMHPMAPRACATYGLVAAGCTASFALLRSHAARTTRNEVHRGIHRRVIRRTWLFLSIYLASVPLAFVNLWLAWVCFVIVPPMLFLPVIRIPVNEVHAPHHRALERSCP